MILILLFDSGESVREKRVYRLLEKIPFGIFDSGKMPVTDIYNIILYTKNNSEVYVFIFDKGIKTYEELGNLIFNFLIIDLERTFFMNF